MGDQLPPHDAGVGALIQQPGKRTQPLAGVFRRDRFQHGQQPILGHQTQHLAHLRSGDWAAGGHLFQERQRVTQRSVRVTRDQSQCLRLDLYPLRFGYVGDVLGDGLVGDGTESEMLAAGDDGRRQLVRLGRRQHEDDVRRRFLQRLEQCVESRLGEHVRLVYRVDLVAGLSWLEANPLLQFPHIVHAGVGGSVDLDQVHQPSLVDRPADSTLVAGPPVLRSQTIDRLGQQTGARRLPRPPRAGEEVGVDHPVVPQRIAQRLDDVILAYYFVEGLGTPLAVQHQVSSSSSREPSRAPASSSRRKMTGPRVSLRRWAMPSRTVAYSRPSPLPAKRSKRHLRRWRWRPR